jgi:hypothetical protein
LPCWNWHFCAYWTWSDCLAFWRSFSSIWVLHSQQFLKSYTLI